MKPSADFVRELNAFVLAKPRRVKKQIVEIWNDEGRYFLNAVTGMKLTKKKFIDYQNAAPPDLGFLIVKNNS